MSWYESIRPNAEILNGNLPISGHALSLQLMQYAIETYKTIYRYESYGDSVDGSGIRNDILAMGFHEFVAAPDRLNPAYTFISDSGYVMLSKIADSVWVLDLYLLDKDVYDKVLDLRETRKLPKAKIPYVWLLRQTQSGYRLSQVTMNSKPFEPGNYTPNISEAFGPLTHALETPDPPGRLVILNGDPGAGKSYFVRGLVHALTDKANFVIMQPRMLAEVSGPALTETFLDFRQNKKTPTVLIIEDADQCLVQRGNDNMGAIATLLNLSDGFVGDMLDLRVIATTNADKLDMDAALTRNGRLFMQLDFKALDAPHATAVYNRLGGKGEVGKMVLADIYAKARGKALAPEKKRAGFFND